MGTDRRDGDPDATPTVAMRPTLSIDPIDAGAPRAADAAWSERGRYALIEEIARGGGGRIALAIDRKLNRKVALKRPLDRGGGERLEREALVLARLEHPAIVPIHDIGEDAEGAPFYAMKLLGGQTLGDRMRAATTFEQRVGLLAAVTTVADAVAYAHSQRVIHRDLKPSNVLVGEFGEVALIDWGLGKIVGDADGAPATTAAGLTAELTRAGTLVGTPAYMAPEQAAGRDVDERADVYALGATLYHLLTGELPYGDVDADATLALLLDGPAPPIGAREPRVPDDLAAIVGKAMARAPADRYRSGRELAEDLHRYQTGRMVAAHRYRPTTRAWRWIRRRRGALAGGAALIAAAIATVAILRGHAAIDPCRDVAAPVARAWNPALRDAAARAFAASAVPYQAASWRQVVTRLDEQAARIGAMRVQACRATRISGEQSGELLSLRMRCLDQRVDELARAAAAFGRADAVTVTRSDAMLAVLGRVDDCADRERLQDTVPLPADPARRARILAIEGELSDFAEREARGELESARWWVLSRTLRALATGYPPLAVRFLIKLGGLIDDDEIAEQMLWIAVATAERAHDDVGRGRALNRLISLEVNHRARYPEAQALIEQALALADRTGDTSQAANLTIYRSEVASALGHAEESLALSERAVELALAGAPDVLDHARYNLGSVYLEVDRAGDAVRLLGQVVESLRGKYGTDEHPDIGRTLTNLGQARFLSGDHDGGIATLTQARAILEHTLPPNGRDVLSLRGNLASMEMEVGQVDRADAELRALLPDLEAYFDPDGADAVAALTNLADIAAGRGHVDEAVARYRDLIARAQRRAPDSIDVADGHRGLGTLLLDHGRAREARPELERALALDTARSGADGDAAAESRDALARARAAVSRSSR